MRPLVLAGILAALVGCSKPYEGTSFAAIPKAEAAAESEAPKQVASAEQENSEVYQSFRTSATGAQHDEAGAPQSMDRTAIVFPNTAQPGGE